MGEPWATVILFELSDNFLLIRLPTTPGTVYSGRGERNTLKTPPPYLSPHAGWYRLRIETPFNQVGKAVTPPYLSAQPGRMRNRQVAAVYVANNPDLKR